MDRAAVQVIWSIFVIESQCVHALEGTDCAQAMSQIPAEKSIDWEAEGLLKMK